MRVWLCFALVGVYLVMVSACGSGSTVEPVASRACAQVLEAPSWRASMVFEQFDRARFGFDVASEQDVAFVDEPAVGPDDAVALTVRGGTKTNGGNRAELSVFDSDPLCQESWTRWHFMIPSDFEDADPEALRWQIIAQWHDQPDTTRGERWEDYPAHSPMLALSYGVYHERYDAELEAVGLGHLKPEVGTPIVTMTYGYGETLKFVGVLPVEKGRWYEVTAHTLFALDDEGFAALWLDDEPLAATEDGYARGRNMYNAAPAYMKLGIYRNPEIKTTNTIYLDELSRAPRREAL